MHEITGDMFDPSTYRSADEKRLFLIPDAICISTNGFVKKNGEAVMGRGCAKRAAQLMPGLPEILGNYLRHIEGGNTVYCHGPWNEMQIVTFPVKGVCEICTSDKSNVVRHMRDRFKPGDKVPGWACVADMGLIQYSAEQLKGMADIHHWKHVVLPRPGAGHGELKWSDVKLILEECLDDRFYAITYR